MCVSAYNIHIYLKYYDLRNVIYFDGTMYLFTTTNTQVIMHKVIFSFQVESARSGLQASLLVKHPETNELFVNFDPQILTLIRETEWMIKLGLEIPPVAKSLKVKQGMLKDNYSKLQVNL